MRWIWLIAVAVGAAGNVGAQTADLPRPAELEPDIQFWVRVYTEIGTSSGFIHDSQTLGAVYRIVRFRDGISRRARRRQLNEAYQGVRDVLAVLADGKRAELSTEEQRVLALWPEDVSNADLRASSRRLRVVFRPDRVFKSRRRRDVAIHALDRIALHANRSYRR